MAGGANLKRPWETSEAEAESQPIQYATLSPNREARSRSQQSPKRWSTQSIDANRPPNLPPISSGTRRTPEHPSQRQYEPQQGSDTPQPNSPKRARISENQSQETFAYEQWLKSTTPQGGQFQPHVGSQNAPAYPYARGTLHPSRSAEFPPRNAMPTQHDLNRPSEGQPLQGGPGFQQAWCGNCGRYQGLAEEMVSGLASLERELRRRTNVAPFQFNDSRRSLQPPQATQVGPREALEWALGTMKAGLAIVQHMPDFHRPSLPQSSHSQFESMRMRIETLERERDDLMARGGTSDGPRTPDISSTSSATGHYRRRSQISDPSPVLQSPVRSTQTSSYPSGQPMHLQPLRALQTPAAVGPPPLPPINTSGQGQPLSSAHVSHIQDLQHQVSTKTLALQTLQQEHDHLISAYSRSQSKCASLEHKYKASDSEIANLTEERIKLSASVEALETQVESLIISRDEARNQSVANGGQYMQIMAMASRLEAQAVSDKSKWKAEEEAWAHDRQTFEARITQLEKERAEAIELAVGECSPFSGRATPEGGPDGKSPLDLRKASVLNSTTTISPPQSSITPTGPTSPTSAPRLPNESSTDSAASTGIVVKDELLESGSLEDLRQEIIRLRKGCAEIELQLMDLKVEGQRIDQVMQKFQNVGKRVTNKAEQIRTIASSARPVSVE